MMDETLQDKLLCSPGRCSLPTCGSLYPSWASRGKTPEEEHWEAWESPSPHLLPGAHTVWPPGS